MRTLTKLLAPAALALLIVPASADARTPTTGRLVDSVDISLEPSFQVEDRTVYAGIEGCERLISENRTVQVEFTANIMVENADSLEGAYFYRVDRDTEASRANCPEDAICNDVAASDIEISENVVTLSIPFRTLSNLSNPSVCTEGDYDRSFYIQLALRDINVGGSPISRSEARVVLDLIRPDAPTITDAIATEYAIQVEFEPATSQDISRYFVVFSAEEFSGGALPADATSRTPRPIEGGADADTGRISVELPAGQNLWVSVASRDRNGNYSVVSDPIAVNVMATQGFWDYYRAAGGTEEGGYGCASTGNQAPLAPLALLLVAGLLLVHRRRARLGTALLAISALGLAHTAAPATAMAQEAPTNGFMEFKLGPYTPNVDGEFGGEGPYQEFFAGRSMLHGELHADYHLWQGIGKLSLGGSAGYGHVRGRMRSEDGEVVETGERATFRIIPLRTSLVYRYDYSALNHGIPLVPVFKGGLNYYFWRVTTPAGDTAESDGVAAAGGKPGWHVSAGLHLHLNFFDRRSAAAFDMSWGIRNSYLFADYTWSRVDGFGSGGLDLSSNHWSIGLAFEF